MVFPTWKFALEALAATAAVGFSAVTMFGADSAPKPRAVPVVHQAIRHPSTPTSTTTSTTTPEASVDDGGSFGGSSGGFGDQTNSTIDGLPESQSAQPGATDPGPPPTVPETEFPAVLPISAVVIVGGGVVALAWNRRRRAESGSGS